MDNDYFANAVWTWDSDDEDDDRVEEAERSKADRPDCHPKENLVDPAQFWDYVGTLKDGADQYKFKNISDCMKLLMSLPHSSASAERNFSKLNIFVSPLRNKLFPKTVQSLFHVTRFIPDVAEWNIETIVSRL